MKHEKPSDNDVNTEIEEAIAYETGRMALEKTPISVTTEAAV